jgi:ankyrin repeat protein
MALLLAGHPASAAEIHDAARAGNVDTVRALLDKAPSLVSARDESGATPLHVAARGAVSALVGLLVERGADVNAVDNSGSAPLHVLAARGDVAGMTLLLDKGADVNIAGGDGGTPLHAATMGRRVDALRLLVARKADVERRNRYGRTPLIVAAREMRGVAVIGTLLELGASIDAADKANDTALSLASWRGSRDVVDLLLARGAAVPIGNAKGQWVLENAISKGLSDLFRRMIEKGAELPAEPPQGRTLLHSAAEGGAAPTIGTILERRYDVNRRDANGWTPIHFAVDMGRGEAIETLLAKGADIDARTVMGQTAYNLAEDNTDVAIMALLAGKGADKTPPRFPDLRGPYLGQNAPGASAGVFAPGIVSARYGLHSNIVFSPDGTEAFWSVMIPARAEGYSTDRTYVSRLVGGRWTYPTRAVFDGVALHDVPFFHPDGQRLYDMSDRPLPGGTPAGKENIWVWDKGRKGWTNPRPLDAVVNRPPHHWQFSVDRAGTVYFSSTWNGARGLFASRLVDGRYGEPEYLAALGPDASFPYVAPDGSYLLFVRGMQDLHVSFRDPQGRWGQPMSFGAEYAGILPIVSADGKYLFVVRMGEGPRWVEAAVIGRLRPE